MNPANSTTNKLLVIGAVHLDDIAQPISPLVSRASNPVNWTQRIGGVGANAACAAVRALSVATPDQVTLVAAVGDDAIATQIRQTLHAAGVDTQLVEFSGTSTGRYTAVMTHDGELHIGLADVALAERLGGSKEHTPSDLNSHKAVLVEANLSHTYLQTIAIETTQHKLKLAAMSVSPVKSLRLIGIAGQIDLLFCNRREALAMNPQLSETASMDELADGLNKAGFTQIVLSDGSSPLLVQDATQRVSLSVDAVKSTQNVNGAGDALAGASFAAWANGMELVKAVQDVGLAQAAMVVSGDHKAPKISSSMAQ